MAFNVLGVATSMTIDNLPPANRIVTDTAPRSAGSRSIWSSLTAWAVPAPAADAGGVADEAMSLAAEASRSASWLTAIGAAPVAARSAAALTAPSEASATGALRNSLWAGVHGLPDGVSGCVGAAAAAPPAADPAASGAAEAVTAERPCEREIGFFASLRAALSIPRYVRVRIALMPREGSPFAAV